MISPIEHRRLNVVRRHVLDDIWELIKAKGLVDPLIASPALGWVKPAALHQSLFLRMQLSRQIVLVLTRLNAIPSKGKTGETACIMAVLNEATALHMLPENVRARFLDNLSQMKTAIASQGTSFNDLMIFRNSELAHSLYDLKIGPGGLSYFVVSQFLDDTIKLVSEIENFLVSVGCEQIADIASFETVWAKAGCDFWEILSN